jgi:hypothetical protein
MTTRWAARSIAAPGPASPTNTSFGGALANAGTLSITGATFTGNAALGSTAPLAVSPTGSQGGAIGNLDGATATITLSTFTSNQALGTGTGIADGGAICNEEGGTAPFTGSGVSCTLSQCTFANNTAKDGATASNVENGGGAIEDNPGTNLAVLSCSLTGNEANNTGGADASGGAIEDSRDVTVTITGSQFISNSAIGSGGADAYGGAVDNLP